MVLTDTEDIFNLTKTGINYDLSSHLPAHTRLLQQVLLYLGSFDGPSLVEVDIDIFPKATGVIVTDGLGISKG